MSILIFTILCAKFIESYLSKISTKSRGIAAKNGIRPQFVAKLPKIEPSNNLFLAKKKGRSFDKSRNILKTAAVVATIGGLGAVASLVGRKIAEEQKGNSQIDLLEEKEIAEGEMKERQVKNGQTFDGEDPNAVQGDPTINFNK